MASNSHAHTENLLGYGFDGVLQFLPQLSVLDCFEPRDWKHRAKRLIANLKLGITASDLHVYDYEESVRKMLLKSDWPVFQSLFPSWDNSARSGRSGVILKNSSPEKFQRLLWEISQQTIAQQPEGHRLVFLNAWNEWAEGNHLEPDQRYGRGYLEAVKQTKDRITSDTAA